MFTRRTLVAALGASLLAGYSTLSLAENKPYVALVSKGFQHQFWQAVKIGAEQAAEEFNVTVTFEGPDGEGAVDRQLDMISAALSKKPSAIAIAAIDSQATVPLLRDAESAGIPVIAFDSGVDSDIPITNASTDNGGDHLRSAEITKTLLLAHPDLKGIFGTNEGSAIGVALGKQEVGSDVVVIGYDSGAAQIAAVRNGTIAGAITQNPVGIGYRSVEAAVKTLNGETVEKHIDTGFYYYDASNIDDPTIAAVLYD